MPRQVLRSAGVDQSQHAQAPPGRPLQVVRSAVVRHEQHEHALAPQVRRAAFVRHLQHVPPTPDCTLQ